MLRLVVVVLYCLMFFLMVRLTAVRDVRILMGRPPIGRVPFVLGKLGMLIVWIYSILGVAGRTQGDYHVPGLEQIGLIITIIGLAIIAVSVINFGSTLTMGIPEDPAVKSADLKTSGLYRFSRNPMYLGFYLTALGTSLFVLKPVVWISAVVSIVIHDRIIRAEEAYLSQEYGQAWEAYRKRVRRYF